MENVLVTDGSLVTIGNIKDIIDSVDEHMGFEFANLISNLVIGGCNNSSRKVTCSCQGAD